MDWLALGLGALIGALPLALLWWVLNGRFWRSRTTLRPVTRASEGIDHALGDAQRHIAQANAQRAAERDVARSRFMNRRVTELVNRGVPVALAEQDAERLYDAVDVSSPYAG